MRVGVIRGDISKALFIADVEPKSQSNASTESPLGNARYVGRPNATAIQAYLDGQGLGASATTLITATVPVGGSVDVSSGTITGVAGLGGATAAQVTALQDLLAPQFVETDALKKSFLYGNLAGYLSANFNPDPRRDPAIANGPAIECVEDDGVTAFTFAAPVLSTATFGSPSAGWIRVAGTSLAPYGSYSFAVIFTRAPLLPNETPVKLFLTQAAIVAAGGSINAAGTQIDVPASLISSKITSATRTEYLARVQVNDMITATSSIGSV